MYDSMYKIIGRCAAAGVCLALAVYWTLFSYSYFWPGHIPYTLPAAFLIGMGLAFLVGLAVTLVLRVIGKLSLIWLTTASACVYLSWLTFGSKTTWLAIFSTWLILIPSLVAASAGFFLFGFRRKHSIALNIFVGAILCTSVLLLIGPIVWFSRDGYLPERLINTAQIGSANTLQAPDPAEMGHYEVQEITYGSGNDRRRPEYAHEANFITTSVDASAMTRGWSGFAGWIRSRYWGFGPESFPLNGRVYFPKQEGTFPLVMILHGNAMMEQESDKGYAYLAQLLASKGYIVVSLDENFLNSSWHSLWHGLRNNNVRAWLLLEHLRLWHSWSQDPESPFYGKVNFDEIALIGHSRGGEAVALATAMSSLKYYPDDATIRLDYPFSIKSVIAIAPVDGQYQLADQATPLRGTNYLVLHGSYDGDVRSFRGAAQYQRTVLDEDTNLFKASVYIHGANHGLFNEQWGRYDAWPPERWLLNVSPLLTKQQVQRIAQVFISAFLDATLKGKTDYKKLFQDVRTGRLWLPNTIYVTSYAQGGDQYVAQYEDGLDITSLGPHTDNVQFGSNLTKWKQSQIWMKWGSIQNRAVIIAWNSKQKPNPSYTLNFASQPENLQNKEALLFSIAPTDSTSSQPIDFSLDLTDSSGNTATVPLSQQFPLQPILKTSLWKVGWVDEPDTESETIFQSYRIALRDFQRANRSLDLSQIQRLRFVFDRTPDGEIALDDIGFR